MQGGGVLEFGELDTCVLAPLTRLTSLHAAYFRSFRLEGGLPPSLRRLSLGYDRPPEDEQQHTSSRWNDPTAHPLVLPALPPGLELDALELRCHLRPLALCLEDLLPCCREVYVHARGLLVGVPAMGEC